MRLQNRYKLFSFLFAVSFQDVVEHSSPQLPIFVVAINACSFTITCSACYLIHVCNLIRMARNTKMRQVLKCKYLGSV